LDRACSLAAQWSGGASTVDRLRTLLRTHSNVAQSNQARGNNAHGNQAHGQGNTQQSSAGEGALTNGQLAMLAFPERIAVRSGDDPGRYQLVSGGVASLGDDDSLRGATVLVAVDLDGDRRAGRIFEAVATTIDEVLSSGQPTVIKRRSQRLPSGRIETTEQTWLGAAILRTQTVVSTVDDVAEAALADLDLAAALSNGAAGALRARMALLAGLDGGIDGSNQPAQTSWPDWSRSALIESVRDWLVPSLRGREAKDPLHGLDLSAILRDTLPFELRRRLDTEAPTHVRIPTGREVKIDYLDDGGPTIEAKLQEFFGTRQGPTIAGGRIPVRLVLLSPKGRPAAITANLGAFWTTGYPAVRTDLRGRYPRHPWPEDPTEAVATARAKPRGT
jgi:ATP-dependent helicase HrpB